MLSADDPFRPHLDEILDLNYASEDFAIDPEREEASPQCPLTFYDRHIASNLLLQRVRLLQLLPASLSTICDEAIRTFLNHGHNFPVPEYCGPWGIIPRVRDSLSVYDYYVGKIGEALPQFPFMLFMVPEHAAWISAFIIQRNPVRIPQDFSTEAGFKVKRSHRFPDVLKIKDENSDSVYKPLVSILHDWARKCPNIGIWEFYAMSKTAKKLLDRMKATALFKWETSHTKGYTIVQPTQERPLDADNGILMKAKADEHASPLRTRSNRKVKHEEANPKTRSRDTNRSQISIPRTRKALKTYKPQPTHFIQHTWSRAVKNDATFMVFNCGDSERIGIRDRKTQTLYLSDLIDPINCRDPTYGKLHLGLHLAIVQDLMQREDPSDTKTRDEQSQARAKRAREDRGDEVFTSKRRRLHEYGPSDEDHTELDAPRIDVAKEMSTHELALISLDYGPYRSPSPSSFFRLGSSCIPGHFDASFTPSKRKTKYSSSEYFNLILREPMGEGATGIVHRALALLSGPGSEVQMNLLVKLALEIDQRERLRAEFAIYQHMASAGERVEGVVSVHGFFEDSQTGVLALLMDDGGTTLMQREQIRTGLTLVEQIQVSDEEREATMCALRSIHKAGVRHRDIRPQNILIDFDNKISIIDFDCADLNPSPEKIEDEDKRMDDLLNGRYVELGSLPF